MCFVKSPKISEPEVVEQDMVQRHQADASLTKSVSQNRIGSGFAQNVKTSPLGLSNEANVQKKTLLGE